MSTQEQRQEWRELPWVLANCSPSIEIMMACLDAVPALLDDVDRLTQAEQAASEANYTFSFDLMQMTAERDALAAELAQYKRNAAYISSVIDSEGVYRP